MCFDLRRIFFLFFLKFKIMSLLGVLIFFLYLHFITIWEDNSEFCISQSGVCDDCSTIYDVDYINNIPLCSPQKCFTLISYKKCLLNLNSDTVLNNLRQFSVSNNHLVIPFLWTVIGMSSTAIFLYLIINCFCASNSTGVWINIIWFAKLTDAVSPLSIILAFYLTTYSKSTKYIDYEACLSNSADSTFCKSISDCNSDIRRVFTNDSPAIYNFVIIANILAAFLIAGIISSIYVFIQALPDEQIQHGVRRAASRAIKLFSNWNFNPPPNPSDEVMECPICLRQMLFMPVAVDKEKESSTHNNSSLRRGPCNHIDLEAKNRSESVFSFRSTRSGPMNVRSNRIAATATGRNSIAEEGVTAGAAASASTHYHNVVRMTRDASIARMVVTSPAIGLYLDRDFIDAHVNADADAKTPYHTLSQRNARRRAASVIQTIGTDHTSSPQDQFDFSTFIRRFNSTEGVPRRGGNAPTITAALPANANRHSQRLTRVQLQRLQSPFQAQTQVPVSVATAGRGDRGSYSLYDEQKDIMNHIRKFSSSSIVIMNRRSELGVTADIKDKDRGGDTVRMAGGDTVRMAGGERSAFARLHSSGSLASSTSTTSIDHVVVRPSFCSPLVLDPNRPPSSWAQQGQGREAKLMGDRLILPVPVSLPVDTETDSRRGGGGSAPTPQIQLEQTTRQQQIESLQDNILFQQPHQQPLPLPQLLHGNSSLSIQSVKTKVQVQAAGAPPQPLLKQDSIYPSDYVLAQVPCGHIFHKACIIEWGLRENTCPACRADLAAGTEENAEGGVYAEGDRLSEGHVERNEWLISHGMA